jgi:acetoin utilization deacetylase AcuC-like enzyme
MSCASLIYYTHPLFLEHDTGPGHPECADRLRVINAALSSPEFAALVQREAPCATREQVELVHTKSYIARLEALAPHSGRVYLDNDTPLSPASLDAARHAAGACCAAVDAVCSTPNTRAFCAVRPPGHHAEPDHGMGFCLFNNVAIAAAWGLHRHKLERIAIVDFDVHHGNGTAVAFVNQPAVLYASTHQHPCYPNTGAATETGCGNTINIPLPAGTDSAHFRSAITWRLLPALHNFKPQLLLISAGFDAHRLDPLAQINLETEDYGWLTEQLMQVAVQHAQGRVVSVLEGGYHLEALAASVVEHVRALMRNQVFASRLAR